MPRAANDTIVCNGMIGEDHGERIAIRPSAKPPLPREHGAWGLALQPFAAAAILTWRWDWLLIPALLLVLLGFLIREPLTVIARQRRAVAPATPASQVAMRWLAIESAGIAVSFAIALAALPWRPLCILVAMGFALTLISVWFAVRNRQRSVGLQIAAVAGLGSSAFVAALAATRTIPEWAWLLWAILTLHGVVSVLCVHARLEIRTRAADPASPDPRRAAAYATLLQLAMTLSVALGGGIGLALPLLFSSLTHVFELTRMANSKHVRERLQRVGWRLLSVSLAHMALTIGGIWPLVER